LPIWNYISIDSGETNFNSKIDNRVTDASIINSIGPSTSKYKIVIAGAGSIGTVLGMLLSREGHDVTLIRKRGPYGAITIDMVGVQNFSHKINVISSKIVSDENVKLTPNIVFIASQRQQLNDQLSDLLNSINFTNDPIIIPLQNGLGTAQIVCNWIQSNTLDLPLLQSIIWWSATLHDSTKVLYHSSALTTIGIPKNVPCQSATLKELELINNLLSEILEVKEVNIDHEPYVKLILNVVSPVLALVKKPYPTGVNDFTVRKIIRMLFEEVIEIAKREGWYKQDDRLDNFYNILTSDRILDHYSLHASYPEHKVSSQISAEKYGGEGSNVQELLSYFISKGGQLCKRLAEIFLQLKPNYNPISSQELADLLRIGD
jgi:ketopantoate reductase